ncbi:MULTISPECIES: flagellar hook-associated protein FlgK [Ensifer]|jgi:flagellar hook-associated protein 1 FlgK|uniref:Flagellar hook-associated protein 1 n=1 Tax=Ensifer canadensis TaxID=555315 RepID=A0AAW4FG38_9HYPH|nr:MULTISPECIES: flagellar hook-associated protein FlgK [Ensifer]AHK43431.1 putative flagellar hook-associated protein FlgK [Ensifer adhaerens OV14]KQU71631.1 flagellar biosynthesis protein FlgK [Ensifer sp. Root31]KQW62792.1 flagellar biosynthesis protein FlgK [Ensifer sp. Root1252]KRC83612.1 flagellar biosynthesis protein FlgK [Ensifer sp. Root231]KRC86484.1 flagellar biosynthesis protein FlgK [Ensifer sp. Root258]
MSLSSAISIAQQAFSNTAQQTAIVSKNIANAGNADYSRRLALLGSTANGAQVVSIYRAQNEALLKQSIAGMGEASGQARLREGLELMKSALGGNSYETAPSKLLADFRNSLQTFAATPGNKTIAATAVSDAGDLADSLNKASKSVQDMRENADKEIALEVDKLNGLLAEFEKANNAVKAATAQGSDPNDALDQRDKILKQVSEIVGISTTTRANNDTVIFTTDGTVLFETIPRSVTFASQNVYDATTVGNKIYVDGVPIAAGTGADTTAKGKLAALVQLRDDVGPKFQSQLDEIARGLVTMFQEGGQPGLFTWGTAGIPPVGIVPGMASKITVNALAKADPLMLRDGGFDGTSNNPTGNAGYTALLDGFINAMGENMAFDPASGLDSNSNILNFATSSVGWLEQFRKTASTADDNKSALLSRTAEALSKQTGVSIDEELSLLLDLEQSYKASAKLVSTVDAMMAALMEAVR